MSVKDEERLIKALERIARTNEQAVKISILTLSAVTKTTTKQINKLLKFKS